MKNTSPALSLPRRLLLALCSPILCLGLFEGVLRVGGFVHMPAVIPMVVWNPIEDQALSSGAGLWLPHRTQLWTPRPGASPSWEPSETINSAGYRGELLELEPSADVLRIATLGDSSTFGLRVAQGETWSAQLALELISHGVAAEVLNGGVVGHTVRQGIERYKSLLRAYRPQLVIAAFGAVNEHIMTKDLQDREKIARRSAYSTWDRLRDGARRELRVLHLAGWTYDKLRGRDRRSMRDAHRQARREMRKYEPAMGQIDWPGKRRVSPERFELCLAELDQLVRADGAQLVLVSMFRHPEKEQQGPVLSLYDQAIERVATQRELPLFDVRQMMERQFTVGRSWEDLFVDHYHPSARGHSVIAKGLARLLLSIPPLSTGRRRPLDR